VADDVAGAVPRTPEAASVAVDALDDGFDDGGFGGWGIGAELPCGFTFGAFGGDLPGAGDVRGVG